MDFRQFVNYTGDSNIKSYSFNNGTLKVIAYIDEFEKDYLLEFKTDTICIDPIEEHDVMTTLFRIEMIDPKSHLREMNGFYIPAEDFAGLMKEKRMSLNLVYGMRVSEVDFLICFKGYSNLLCFPVQNIDDIKFGEYYGEDLKIS